MITQFFNTAIIIIILEVIYFINFILLKLRHIQKF